MADSPAEEGAQAPDREAAAQFIALLGTLTIALSLLGIGGSLAMATAEAATLSGVIIGLFWSLFFVALSVVAILVWWRSRGIIQEMVDALMGAGSRQAERLGELTGTFAIGLIAGLAVMTVLSWGAMMGASDTGGGMGGWQPGDMMPMAGTGNWPPPGVPHQQYGQGLGFGPSGGSGHGAYQFAPEPGDIRR